MGLINSVYKGFALLSSDTWATCKAVWDKRSPWSAKLLFLALVAYVVSPIDLIPDFILVLGLIDDVVIVAFGLKMIRKLIPAEVLETRR